MKTTPTLAESRSFELLIANKKVLELMAGHRPLPEILDAVVGLIETFASGCISTVYFIVDGKLAAGAAPSFPADFVKAVEGCPIGLNHGTCGHAAFTGKRAISTDVMTDEVWGPYRDWILSYGIKAAWSTPVIGENGEVLATVSMCWKTPRVPTEWDFEIVDTATSLMRIAVERKKQEDMIAEQRLKLVTSSRLAALGEMAANLAHEVNNPLSIIQGHSNLLQLISAKPEVGVEPIRKTAVEIEKTVTRISGIIKGLKSISKDGDSDPFLPADLRTIVEETLAFCRERFKRNNVELIIDYSEGLWAIDCRQVQISQTLLNLVNNAFDAVVNLEERWVKVSCAVREGNCHIRVTDSGAGIPEEIARKIMDPFFTTKTAGHGTGLGLSISKKIIEAHGGELLLNREVPNTCFEIRLPVKQQEVLA